MFEISGKNGRRLHPLACYPEQMEPPDHTGQKVWRYAAWHLWHRWRRNGNRLAWIVKKTDALAADMARLSDARLRAEREDLKSCLRHQGFAPPLVARSFALIRETASRTLGKRHFSVQLMGGLALLQGCLAEMSTGEGKTLTATLPAATAALAGLPVHVITVNDYLVARDADLMRPLYGALGLSVGCIVQGMDPRRPEKRPIAAISPIATTRNWYLTTSRTRSAWGPRPLRFTCNWNAFTGTVPGQTGCCTGGSTLPWWTRRTV